VGWTWSPMARGPLGEDRTLECTMELDERTFKIADNTLAIALGIRLKCEQWGPTNGREF
jgi:hypothetical protein